MKRGTATKRSTKQRKRHVQGSDTRFSSSGFFMDPFPQGDTIDNLSLVATQLVIIYRRCQRHLQWNSCKNIILSTPQKWTKEKNYYMSVNSNLTASQQNRKKLSDKKYFPFITDSWKNLKSKILCQTPFKASSHTVQYVCVS